MWTLIVMALAALLWLVVVTMGHGAGAMPDGLSMTALEYAALGLTALAVAQLLQRLLGYTLLNGKPDRGQASSDLVRSVINVALYLVVGVLFLHYGLGQDVTSVLATSAIVTGIMGLALQPTLGHLFSGVSIEIERPLRVGDFVRRDDLEGRVISLSWRSISLETDRGTVIVMPNAEFTSRPAEIIRANRPSRHQIVFSMASDCSPTQVTSIALEVLRSNLTGIVQTPAPSVVIVGADPLTGTLRFGARFYTLNFLDRSRIASLFMERLWYALSREGLALPPRPVLEWSMDEAALRKHGERDLAGDMAADGLAWRFTQAGTAAGGSGRLQARVIELLAALPADLGQAMLAGGQIERYGPDERCGRGLAGLVIQGRLTESRLPEPGQRAAALARLRERVATGAPASPDRLQMDAEHCDLFIRHGAMVIGPLAHSLCLRIASHTDDLGLAYELLAESIQNEDRRKAFMLQAPVHGQTRIEAGGWFGWPGVLGLEDHAAPCRAIQECAVFVWSEASLKPIFEHTAQADVQAFCTLLQTHAPGCQALTYAQIERWARRLA